MKIITSKGMLEEASLRKVTGSIDNDNESTTFEEWYLGDELVKRNAHVALKKWPQGTGPAATQTGKIQ